MKRIGISIIVILLSLGAAHRALAQDDATPPREAPSVSPELEKLLLLEQQLNEAIEKEDWETAAANCREQIEILPDRPDPYYNLACVLARSKKPDEALVALKQSIDHGWAEPTHTRSDPDLAPLHGKTDFDELIAQARKNELAAPYDKGKPIEGIRTYEAFPDGGLRYRLRYDPKATKSHPNKLIIWLHPSGGSMNDAVEKLAPEMVKHGYALMVITRKQFAGWSDDDFTRLREKTLVDLGNVPMVDARKPILLGFSAGGQMAITAWAKDPAAWGGLILDAAYPLDVDEYIRGKIVPMPLPLKDEIKKCPIYSVLGGNDKGLEMWHELAPHWIEAGVPLTLRTVEGKGHEWLLDDAKWKDVTKWLDQVNDGTLPTDPAKPSKE